MDVLWKTGHRGVMTLSSRRSQKWKFTTPEIPDSEERAPGVWVSDWNPELGVTQDFRVLNGSESAEGGEDFLMESPGGTL